MASKQIFSVVLAASFLGLVGCANLTKGTIKDSVVLNSKEIAIPAMKKLSPREIALTVVDERAPEFKEHSAEMKAEIYRALSLALGNQGIALKTDAKNALTLTIQDFKTDKFQEGCVKLNASLNIPNKGKANSTSNSCLEYKNPFGLKVGSDIGKAYEEALTLAFKNLDAGLEQLP